jgi:hypothetical protein
MAGRHVKTSLKSHVIVGSGYLHQVVWRLEGTSSTHMRFGITSRRNDELCLLAYALKMSQHGRYYKCVFHSLTMKVL